MKKGKKGSISVTSFSLGSAFPREVVRGGEKENMRLYAITSVGGRGKGEG